jgi:hypothetical protein
VSNEDVERDGIEGQIVLACVIAAGANVAVWLKGVALNTNAWVA